jgi:NAD(P)-dependent dehydrogenase (short-subunit alcohol dehydrogenase family)
MSGTNGHNGHNGLGDWNDNNTHRLDFSQHVAVVTGGARGIGRAACLSMAREGVRAVAVVDQLEEVASFTDKANEKFGRKVLIPFRGDVTSGEFRRNVFAEMQSLYGSVSVCIPAAGITRDRLAVKIDKETGQADIYSEADFERVLGVDLTAPIFWAMETLASVAQKRHGKGLGRWLPSEGVEGCIIFIGSVSSSGNKGQVSYATAKAGLEGAQATLAAEAVFHGVRCAIIHPGFTDTAMVRALGADFISKHVLPQTQLGRLIQPEEIADAICFMIRNSTVSGQLWADAGWHPTV